MSALRLAPEHAAWAELAATLVNTRPRDTDPAEKLVGLAELTALLALCPEPAPAAGERDVAPLRELRPALVEAFEATAPPDFAEAVNPLLALAPWQLARRATGRGRRASDSDRPRSSARPLVGAASACGLAELLARDVLRRDDCLCAVVDVSRNGTAATARGRARTAPRCHRREPRTRVLGKRLRSVGRLQPARRLATSSPRRSRAAPTPERPSASCCSRSARPPGGRTASARADCSPPRSRRPPARAVGRAAARPGPRRPARPGRGVRRLRDRARGRLARAWARPVRPRRCRGGRGRRVRAAADRRPQQPLDRDRAELDRRNTGLAAPPAGRTEDRAPATRRERSGRGLGRRHATGSAGTLGPGARRGAGLRDRRRSPRC